MNKPSYEQRLEEAIAFLLLGGNAMLSDLDHDHDFYWESDGDGWNEPYSDSFSCHCNDWGISWVQQDRDCSGRIDLHEAVLQWVAHIHDTLYKVNEEDNGDLPQDSNPF